MKWTLDNAMKFVRARIASSKVILIDGTMTLAECSAADYLTKFHGYTQRVTAKGGK